MKGNQRIALTKRLLHEGLLDILRLKPLDKVTVTELCNKSGINRATFYRHFNTPRDVLLDMQLEFINSVYSFCNILIMHRAPLDCLEELCTYLYNHSELIKIFIHNNSEEDLTNMFNSFFQSFFENKARFKNIDNIDETSLKLISTYIAGGGYALVRQWLLEDIDKTPKEMAELVLKFFNKEYITLL